MKSDEKEFPKASIYNNGIVLLCIYLFPILLSIAAMIKVYNSSDKGSIHKIECGTSKLIPDKTNFVPVEEVTITYE